MPWPSCRSVDVGKVMAAISPFSICVSMCYLPWEAPIYTFRWISRSRLAEPQIKRFMLAARCEFSTLLSALSCSLLQNIYA